ncbi:hypothetical protein [Poseidonibacter lekithochrous]|uniref:hypothetical protein n=1 Tax=Poseidonibacter lekithochrous TaxID=1904463 RepID=UPI0008FC9B0F|nr:hypothetical protein [Poseidonibacter lekithochrous]QKJ24085.1 hypothetical protein ALEK_2862 [Poseidonibacter lekithochrous]
MSMSQEEIEALMNGLDIADDASEPEETASEEANLSSNEIDELISSTSDVVEPEVTASIDLDNVIEEVSSPENLDISEMAVNETVNNSDIDDLLKDLEEPTSVVEPTPVVEEESLDLENFDDILSGIDGVIDNEPEVKEEVVSVPKQKETFSDKDKDEIVRDWTDSKINEGIFPLPAEKDTKVVSQLNQVANDSEEKVGQIFDVLSLGLDNNNECRSKITEVESFLSSQTNLLNSLHSKFPNIQVFEQHLGEIQNVNESLTGLKNAMNDEDMKIFEAMELMQFNDINRQKIERVMAVIKKLSSYLNNLFEDEDDSKDIVVARHIHGDDNNDLIGEDLDKLIAEFGN